MTVVAGHPPVDATLLERPPGERYYRHPGDVVRVVVWGAATLVLGLLVALETATSGGVRRDLAAVATSAPLPVRQLILALVQGAAVAAPAAVVVVLLVQHRYRRLGTLAVAAGAGAALALALAELPDARFSVPGALGDGSWLVSTRFPSLAYLGALAAGTAVGKPWLSRGWRRVADLSVVVLIVTMAMAGTAGAPELLLVAAGGTLAGAATLVVLGAPNRRPTPAVVAGALAAAGSPVDGLIVERAVGGRAQLYRAATPRGGRFLKVYGRDSRDADLLYATYRRVVLRDPADAVAGSLSGQVEHEALLLLLAERAGVACPPLDDVVALADGSMVLAMADVSGRRLDELLPDELDDARLAELWRQVAALHAAGLAHGALRAANVLVAPDGHVVLIDFGAGRAAASARDQALDRAGLLASLSTLVGPERAVAAAGAVIDGDALAAAMPFLQPLALPAATSRATSKSTLAALRQLIASRTGHEPAALEQLVRIRPRTICMTVALAVAFYVLLPQLADVDDSVGALASANWWWLAATIVMSATTYVAAAVGLVGGVRQPLPLLPTIQVSVASSFVNRMTPANVGGMALNVRYLQKSGIAPAEAVTGVGLNVIAGGIVHLLLLVVFLAWSGRGGESSFSLPASSTLLVVIAVLLAALGVVLATRWGRTRVRAHVLPALRESLASLRSLAGSPVRLLALFGGSAGVTLAYIGALAFAIAAFDGGISFPQVGAVYLGASLLAAAAPTPGGLGAIEAALVAALTAVGMDSATAVAAVLSYRLLTYWLPILPGWLFLQLLKRRNYI